MIPNLGRLEPVDPRSVWAHEAHVFTPWLALPENLALLSETLGLDLELQAVEQAVGPFRADILCRQTGSSHWVLIENQLERTDHCHLGQILTYAAGLDAVTVVWISPNFTEEHRACLDWLNRSTLKDLNFFGVQMEVWRIGDSQLAPRFHVVSQPNDWSKSVSGATSSLGKPETQQAHLDYWSAYRDLVALQNPGQLRVGKPQPENWLSLSPFGKSEFSLQVSTNRMNQTVKVLLYIGGQQPHMWFKALQTHQDMIEKRLGPLVWNESASKDRTVAQYLEGADPTDRDDWPRQHQWLMERSIAFIREFSPVLARLRPTLGDLTEAPNT